MNVQDVVIEHTLKAVRNHLFKKQKACPGTRETIELTDEIKQHILDNKIYKVIHQPRNNKRTEIFYQACIEKFLGGTHKRLKCGITDVTTDDTHAEIKNWDSWKSALGQLICYNGEDPKPNLQVFLFGTPIKRKVVFETFANNNIHAYELRDVDDGVHIIDSNGIIIYQHSLYDN